MIDVDFMYKPCTVQKPYKHAAPEAVNIGSILYFHEAKWPAGTQVSFLHGKENYTVQKIDDSTWAWKTTSTEWQILKAKKLHDLIDKLFKNQ